MLTAGLVDANHKVFVFGEVSNVTPFSTLTLVCCMAVCKLMHRDMTWTFNGMPFGWQRAILGPPFCCTGQVAFHSYFFAMIRSVAAVGHLRLLLDIYHAHHLKSSYRHTHKHIFSQGRLSPCIFFTIGAHAVHCVRGCCNEISTALGTGINTNDTPIQLGVAVVIHV
jgi:hypothetical protein